MAIHFFDVYAGVGLVLVFVPVLAWLGILRSHHQSLTVGTERVQVLIVRTSLFLPTYAILLWLSLVLPPLYPILEGPIAVAEGISFICFFAVIVANCGGPDGCLKAMIAQNRKPCCCCPSDPFRMYKRVRFAVHQFLVYRPIVVIVGAIFVYVEVQPVFLACKFVSTAMFVFGFGSLAMFFENVMRVNENINGTCKILLIKVSVGAIVVQGLVEEFLFASGVLKIKDTDRYSAEERAQRGLMMLLLMEYCILSVLLFINFGSEVKMNAIIKTDSTSHKPLSYPMSTFLKKVFKITDVFDNLTLKPGLEEHLLLHKDQYSSIDGDSQDSRNESFKNPILSLEEGDYQATQ